MSHETVGGLCWCGHPIGHSGPCQMFAGERPTVKSEHNNDLRAQLASAVEAKEKAERELMLCRCTLIDQSALTQERTRERDEARATSQRQAVEIEELRDRSQGYQADCRIYERDLLAIQSAYTKLCATFGMNGDGSRSPEIVALCDAIENSSQQSDGPKVARRKTDSPLVSLYDDPEFMEQWTKEMQTHTLTDAAIKEKS